MEEKFRQMKELAERLNEAAKAYYQENREIMPNIEYDLLYDRLQTMEKETGMVLSNSPTVRVGYELLSHLPRETHEKPMLSLDKTKDTAALREWLGQHKGVLSWKLDGLTIVLTYADGQLAKAVTRGNGEVGEVITSNARVFRNVPLTIPYKESLVIRGEAVISYSEFERINQGIEETDMKYKNPRNLCSGSVRQLNNRVTAERNVSFFAFSLVRAEHVEFGNSRIGQLNWLKDQGFDIVEYKEVTETNLEETVKWFAGRIQSNDFPADGLVLTYDDIAFGESLGQTSKFPRDAIAFKWKDEIMETRLLGIEWSASRTGLINPVAFFQPIELEGTTVSRASVHNVSVMESLALGVGDIISVYKANMIIPQIAENQTRSGTVKIPENCPVCGENTRIKQENGVKSLYCDNPDCMAKQIKSFTHFVGRNAMGIDGLSEATLEKFIAKGFIQEYADIYRLERYREQIVEVEGLGVKSYEKLIRAIDKSRKTNTVRFLYGLGIPNIGLSNAKLICRAFSDDWHRISRATYKELVDINGIGDVLAREYTDFFSQPKNQDRVSHLLEEIEFDSIRPSHTRFFENKQFVITGAVSHFKNRNELRNIIESNGGRTTDSVTAKTDYLINNDKTSNSSKNKKAKELGISIITEDQFVEWLYNGMAPK